MNETPRPENEAMTRAELEAYIEAWAGAYLRKVRAELRRMDRQLARLSAPAPATPPRPSVPSSPPAPAAPSSPPVEGSMVLRPLAPSPSPPAPAAPSSTPADGGMVLRALAPAGRDAADASPAEL